MIRRASAADAAALHEVAAATFALACPAGTLQRDIDEFIATVLSEQSFGAYLADPDRELFVAEVPETEAPETEAPGAEEPGHTQGLDGYLMLVHGEPADEQVAAALGARPTAEISKIYVRREAHGAGIAGELMAAALEAARRRGAEAVWLGVNQFNARANAFYERQGFALVGTKRFLVGAQWHDDFVRERPF